MTTLLESMGFFSEIFEFFIPFLLVFAVTFGVLLKSKFLSEDANVNAAIAFAVAVIVALGGGGSFLMALTPFFAVFFIIIFFIIMIFMFFGVDPSEAMKSKVVVGLIIVICTIFTFYVIGEFFGDRLAAATTVEEPEVNVTDNGEPATPADPDAAASATGATAVAYIISHPSVLGAMTLLGLLAVAAYVIVNKPV